MAVRPEDLDGRTADLCDALGHPLRVRIFDRLSERPASPSELSRELGEPLGTVSYHVRVLAGGGWIELVATRPRRGAIEHFYKPSGKASRSVAQLDELAWTQLLEEADSLSARVVELEAETAERAASDGASAQLPVTLITLVHSVRPPAPPEATPGG